MSGELLPPLPRSDGADDRRLLQEMNITHFGDCRETMRRLIAQGVKVQMPDTLRKSLQAQARRIDDTDCILSGRPWYVGA